MNNTIIQRKMDGSCKLPEFSSVYSEKAPEPGHVNTKVAAHIS
jgi:hypothetical protein